jgi:hypothetical protein
MLAWSVAHAKSQLALNDRRTYPAKYPFIRMSRMTHNARSVFFIVQKSSIVGPLPCLSRRRLEEERNHPAIPKVDPVPTTGAVLTPNDLRDADVCDGKFPRKPLSSQEGIDDSRLRGSETDYGCGIDAYSAVFDHCHFAC